MYRITQNGKGITAALLLGLLVYILVEKNAHGHVAGKNTGSKNNHAAIHSGLTCLVCDFQLPAADVVPEGYSLLNILVFCSSTACSLPGHYIDPTPSPFTERGPPPIC